MGTKVGWVRNRDGSQGESWNSMNGCRKISPGCDLCYASSIATRFAGTKAYPNGFDVTLYPERLGVPLKRRKPTTWFVNSMGDLFEDAVPDTFIAEVFAVMAATPRHTYIVLTKGHARMRTLLNSPNWRGSVAGQLRLLLPDQPFGEFDALMEPFIGGVGLPNVWLGVSAENQKWADIRVPELLRTPAAVRVVSYEPALERVDLSAYLDQLGWVIVGGESGLPSKVRRMDPGWPRDMLGQCARAGVPFFMKQTGVRLSREWGLESSSGDKPREWPEDLRVQEMPPFSVLPGQLPLGAAV